MVVSCIFSLSSLSNLLKYENLCSTDAEDEGRNKFKKHINLEFHWIKIHDIH